jgi:CRP-like cAMP-binding protein
MAFDGVFKRLTSDERKILLDRGEARAFKPGEMIIWQGRPHEGLFLVAEGEVRVEHGFRVLREGILRNPDGSKKRGQVPGRLAVEVARLGPGAIFGEMSFIDDAPTSANVAAVTPVKVLFIGRAEIDRLLDENPLIARHFYHSLAEVLSLRLRDANKRTRGGRPTGSRRVRRRGAAQVGGAGR